MSIVLGGNALLKRSESLTRIYSMRTSRRPSPEPIGLVELPTIKLSTRAGVLVICGGGGGIPVIRDRAGRLFGVESVVDKDLTTALLAEKLDADVLLFLTDVAGAEDDFGTSRARTLSRCTPAELRHRKFPAGSMGPKVEAACRFVDATMRCAAIGRVQDAALLLAGKAGTTIGPV